MRAIIDIPQVKLEALNEICHKQHISRAELIRRCIDFYLTAKAPALDTAFGILKNQKLDGLEYQKQIREEW